MDPLNAQASPPVDSAFTPESPATSAERKIAHLEQEVRDLRDAQYRTLRMLDQVTAELEAQRIAQLRLKKSYANFDERLSNTTRLAESIEQSKIWQSLKSAAGAALRWNARLRGLPPPVATTAPAPVKSSTAKALTKARKRVKASDLRAAAARHSAGRTGIENWLPLLQTLVRTRPQPVTATARLSLLTPTYNTKPEWFAELAVSVLEQTSADWEWIIVDDASTDRAFHGLFSALDACPRIRIEKLNRNGNISAATNHALALAQGEFVACLDHDDLLHPRAVEQCLQTLDAQGLDAVYTDSDKIDTFGMRSEPFHKPAWSPDYFRGVMYIGHLLCVRRELAQQVKGFDSAFDRIQDYEFFLRVSESTAKVGHIAEILYHWRTVPGSIATSSDAKGVIADLQTRAVQQHLDRLHLAATAAAGPGPHRVTVAPKPRPTSPKISIVIPTRDAADVLGMCLSSLYGKSTYPNFEVILADNDTQEDRAKRLFREYPVKVVPCPGKFNFSRSNNVGIAASDGEFIVCLNNDIEIVSPDWLEQMLFYAEQSDVGAVGAKLVYPDRTIQHAGVILGMRGTADHAMRFAAEDADGYAGSLSIAHEVSAVTAACLMLKRADFDRIGGFNEHYFTAYQDVDLCMELRRLGLRNIYQPHALLIHHESRTRGKYYDHVDRHLLLDRFEIEIRKGDPYYNPNFELETGDYRLAALE